MHPVDRLMAPAADAMHAIEWISDFMFAVLTPKDAFVFRKFANIIESVWIEDEGILV